MISYISSNKKYYLMLFTGVIVALAAAKLFADPEGFGLLPWVFGGFLIAEVMNFLSWRSDREKVNSTETTSKS
ncbi:hypothetical protein [Planomicrobium sp. Y74]|uniref:hypothetical protein n=1 Tax=Planomicrobium sp. Y74 TaxID=2478977 RepID=UPI000EF5029A|nr:hypothetical protein [Planomicrobium sp. Y74]RLQ89874.1 hypothetical protein D9754_13865 [Planomicrobium sp. Y74]